MNVNDLKSKGLAFVNGKLIDINKKSKSKFRNTKICIDGFTFDSIKEGDYYSILKLRKMAGEILDFERQVKFEISINNIHIANYFLDFRITHLDLSKEYIDVKGHDKKTNKWIKTDVFQLKKKLVEAIYGITIKIV